MPRFAILAHDHPFPHWDLLLEEGEVCRTWRLLSEPSPGRAVPAEPIPDHRPHYLTYEGPVPGDRGTVTRWDAGTFERYAGRAGVIDIELTGRKLNGRWCLCESPDAASPLLFRPRNTASPQDPLDDITLS